MSWPIRLGRLAIAAEAVGLAVALVLVALAVGRCQGEREAEASATVQAAHKLADAYRAERKSRALERAEAKVETVTVVVTRRLARVDTLIADVDATLADSAATVPVLRAQLARSRTELAGFRADVDSLIAAHAAYRLAVERRLSLADSTITAQARAITALKCRIGPFPCPRRSTVGLVAGGIGLALGLAR